MRAKNAYEPSYCDLCVAFGLLVVIGFIGIAAIVWLYMTYLGISGVH